MDKEEKVKSALHELHKAVMELWPDTHSFTATFYSGRNKLTVTNDQYARASVYDADDYRVTTEATNA